MSIVDQYFEATKLAAMAKLTNDFPAKLDQLKGWVTADATGMNPNFCMNLASADTAFRTEIAAKVVETNPAYTATNAVVMELTAYVRSELLELLDSLRTMELWVHLSVPAISDGNNFGVEIQEHICKRITELRTSSKAMLDGLAVYNKDRADAWTKAVFRQTTKTSGSQDSKKSTGGEKDVNESSTTEKVDTSMHVVSNDAVEYLVAYDVTAYFTLRQNCQDIFKTYAICLDMITKNLSKIEDPRGDGENQMSMF
jgi:hypothetical protein